MTDEIAISFVMNNRVMGFTTKKSAIELMDSCKTTDHIVLPTKFRIMGYNYKINHGYESVEFEILPIDDLKLDDLLK